MNVALLCPGPSLSLFDGEHEGPIVAVNRAALRHRCDFWAAMDFPLIERIGADVLGSPMLLTSQETISEMTKRGIGWRGDVGFARDLSSYCPSSLEWDLFTAPTALVFAGFIGATRIDIWGMDWKGLADFDGVEAGENRSPERWALDRGIIQNRLIPWLRYRGIDVVRHTLEAAHEIVG